MDPINITSSDSEDEVAVEKITSLGVGPPASQTVRKLPSWASTSGPNSTSYNGSHKMPLFPGRTSVFNNQIKANGDKSKTLNQESALTDYSLNFQENGYTDQPKNFFDIENLGTTGGNNGMFGMAPGKDLSQHNSKRILPTSLDPFSPSTKSKTSMENEGCSYLADTNGKSNHFGSENATDHKFYMKDHLVKGKDNDVTLYDHRGSRLLPPSLTQAKSVASPYSSSNEHAFHPGFGEERSAENDERVIFQAALQDLSQPKVEATLPDGLLAVPLLRHQKIALAWMLQKETPSMHCLGGILADDQGLGKTVSMIALVQMQMPLQSRYTSDDQCSSKPEPLSLDDDDDDGGAVSHSVNLNCDRELSDGKRISKLTTDVPAFYKGRPAAGTLVVCPASVLRQWYAELNDKVAESAKLKVLVYHGGTRTKDPAELAKYDVVLTTYSIVTNEVPKQPLVDEDDGDQRNGEKYGLSSDFSASTRKKKASNANKKGKKKGRKGTDGSSVDFGCGALARVAWFRVVLDEAQTIKNHRTQVARACCCLRAKRRWCLSGTPIQNTIDDLYSYFRFLKYDPYAVYKNFCLQIKYPISKNASSGYKKLQAVLKTIMLRRTKGTLIDGDPIINLPAKSVNLRKVEFSTEERAFYLNLEADSRSQFKKYAAAGTVNQNYANILLMLLRLRQACDHPLLVKEYRPDPVRKASLEMARKLPKDMLVNLLDCLETSLAICGVCSDPPEDAVVTMCGHVFCYQCVSEYLTGDDNQCPAPGCTESLGSDIVFSGATLKSCIVDELDGSTNSYEVAEISEAPLNVYSSSKIRAAIELLQSLDNPNHPNLGLCSQGSNAISSTSAAASSDYCSSDANNGPYVHPDPQPGPIKSIIFSQWTSMLNLVEIALNDSHLQYRRLDGTMSLALRDKAVKDFNSDPEVTVMLMSLKAGNLGLNMVAACHVILLDLWWNPTSEDQAIDRAHRIGQTRPVTVTRMTVKDTVEDRILALQEEKRKMVASAFGEDQAGGSATRLTVEDLRYLFMV